VFLRRVLLAGAPTRGSARGGKSEVSEAEGVPRPENETGSGGAVASETWIWRRGTPASAPCVAG